MNLSSMPDKTRKRRSNAEIFELRRALAELVEANRPLTVRHLFYLAVARGLIEKTEDQYQNTIIRLVGIMREEWLDEDREWIGSDVDEPRAAVIPFDSIVDAGRWIRKPQSYTGPEAAVRYWADCYRRDLWHESPVNVIFICEKDAIAELVYQETSQWDVPLAVIRGMSSKTFLYQNAQAIDAADKETYLYFFGRPRRRRRQHHQVGSRADSPLREYREKNPLGKDCGDRGADRAASSAAASPQEDRWR